ncbi:MAG: hypothetical protein HOH86_10050, partial [Verrucomicrobiales bacterium]|nr:hypothetical protein [Verrucomicrobiales bacterium]
MPLPVISVAQMREWEERAWAAGASEEVVMKLAGEAVARRAFDLENNSGSSILFLVGKGKNGGDARIAAELLRAEGVKGVQLM